MVWYKILVAVLILFLIVMLVFYWYVTYIFLYTVFTKKAPFVSSFNRHLNLMISELKLEKGKTMVDLGCGSGKALRFFVKHFNLKSCDWLDFDRTAVLYWKILNKIWWYKNINLWHSDFAEADLKKYDYVYLYLRPSQLDKMHDRIFSSIKKNTIVISNSFKFSAHKPFQVIKNEKWIESIFMYKS